MLSVGKDVEQMELSYTACWNLKWQNHFENHTDSFSYR